MKTLIAIPCMDTIPVGFMQSILYLNKPEGTSVCFNPNSLVYDSRNVLSITAINEGYDRVLWVDSDMLFPSDTLVRLSADMDKLGAEMVTGLYFTRKYPVTPVLYRVLDEPVLLPDGQVHKQIHEYTDYPADTTFPVRGCGFGCCMTSVKLLKEVWDNFGPAFAPYPWGGEDISFCHRVNLLGYDIYCDSSISLGHIGQFVYSEKLFTKEGEQHEIH